MLQEINDRNDTDYQQKDVYFDFQREVMTNASDNAQIEKTDAETEQVKINTLLNLASTLDQETIVQNICDVLDIDYEEIKDKLPEEDNLVDAQNEIDNVIVKVKALNKRQKEVIQSQLKDEEAIIKKLKATYNKAIRDINQKIKILQADELTQSKIYQIEYQKALKMQIKAILDNLNANQYTDIQEYLKKCYEEGFLGTMYDLQGQGIPLVFPIDQNQVVKALTNDTKLSKSLYESLGFHVKTLSKANKRRNKPWNCEWVFLQ